MGPESKAFTPKKELTKSSRKRLMSLIAGQEGRLCAFTVVARQLLGQSSTKDDHRGVLESTRQLRRSNRKKYGVPYSEPMIDIDKEMDELIKKF